MRRKPWARPELAACPFYFSDECGRPPAACRGAWHAQFARPAAPLWVELGCGKGGFAAAAAAALPEVDLLAVDIKSEVLALAARKAQAAHAAAGRPVDNLLLAAQEISLIGQILAPSDAVQRLFIHFCNPWPKASHHKRRLTHPRQLVQYRQFLAPGALLFFKTDDDELFCDTQEYLAAAGFAVAFTAHDLYAGAAPAPAALACGAEAAPAALAAALRALPTEHEQMFRAQGLAIHALAARMLPQLPQGPLVREALRSLQGCPGVTLP